jgi:hypothetical protein
MPFLVYMRTIKAEILDPVVNLASVPNRNWWSERDKSVPCKLTMTVSAQELKKVAASETINKVS